MTRNEAMNKLTDLGRQLFAKGSGQDEYVNAVATLYRIPGDVEALLAERDLLELTDELFKRFEGTIIAGHRGEQTLVLNNGQLTTGVGLARAAVLQLESEMLQEMYGDAR